jgi:hypothetical protein
MVASKEGGIGWGNVWAGSDVDVGVGVGGCWLWGVRGFVLLVVVVVTSSLEPLGKVKNLTVEIGFRSCLVVGRISKEFSSTDHRPFLHRYSHV